MIGMSFHPLAALLMPMVPSGRRQTLRRAQPPASKPPTGGLKLGNSIVGQKTRSETLVDESRAPRLDLTVQLGRRLSPSAVNAV